MPRTRPGPSKERPLDPETSPCGVRRGWRLLRWQRPSPQAPGDSPRPTASPGVPDDDSEPAYRPIDRRLLGRLLACLRPFWRQYTLGIGLGVVMVALDLLSPLFLQAMIDLSCGYAAGTLAPPLEERAVIARLCGIVGVWVIVVAAAIALQRVTILIMTGAGERVQFDLRRRMFAHLQRLSMSYFDRTRLGRIISRFSSDLSGLREVNVWGIDTVAKNLLVLVISAALMLRTEWRLFLSVVWLGPVLYVCNWAFRSKLSGAWQVVREGYTRVASNLAENITGVQVVSAFNRQSWNLRAFNALQTTNTANNIRAARINGVYQPVLQLIGFLGRAIIVAHGSYLYATGSIQGVGSVVAFLLYWNFFMGPIVAFGNFHNQLLMSLAGAERLFNLLETAPEVEDAPDARPLPALSGHVRFERVTFGYAPQRPVLREVDFEARAGETVALVGATGSGKSSVISLLARFYLPQEGRILFDGHDTRMATGASLHHQIGLVLQMNFLFSGTVFDNVRYARPTASLEEVREAARALGTLEAIEALRDGFATEVGERGARMSLGQRQLICFTRAFLASPRILLLDEATSAVDSVTEAVIQRSLERLIEDRTTFIVAHRLSTIVRADQILVLEAGRILERGRHGDLLEAGGRYAKLYREFLAAG